MSAQCEKRGPSAWPHRWAWLLACATFPLIWVGGLVTTTDAGMAFRDWMTSDGTFFLFYDWLSSAGDKFVEHGHRLLGALVGAIVSAWWAPAGGPWLPASKAPGGGRAATCVGSAVRRGYR